MQATPDKSPSLFERMKSFSGRTKKLKLALPEDVVAEVPEFDPGELDRAEREGRKPKPARIQLQIREGAETFEFEIRALSDLENEMANRFLDAAVAPQIYIEEASDRPGSPPKRVPAGYNEEDPKFLRDLREAQAKESAYIALTGTLGLAESVPGDGEADKIEALRGSLDSKMIGWLATNIRGFTYAGGDLADFFTSGPSAESRS